MTLLRGISSGFVLILHAADHRRLPVQSGLRAEVMPCYALPTRGRSSFWLRLFYDRLMDDWGILSPLRWKQQKAIRYNDLELQLTHSP